MVLVTHAVIGAALTTRIGNILGSFLVGVVSHYIFDMVPHWHYPAPRLIKAVNTKPGTKSVTFTRQLFPDMVRVAIDLALGISLSLIFFDADMPVILAGAFGAVLPDLLAGSAKIWPLPPLVLHERIHRWIHTDIRIDNRHIIGISSQVLLIILFILLFS